MSSPFSVEQVTPTLTRIYVGKNVTIWLSYSTPIAFAVNGYGTFKLDGDAETTATRKHLAMIAAKGTMPRDEFNARVATLAYGLDDEATRVIERPSWDDAEATIRTIDTAARRNGWEI